MTINEDFFDSQEITIKDDSSVAEIKNPGDKNSYTHTILIDLQFNNRIDSYNVMLNNKKWLYDRIEWIITMFERFVKRCMDCFDDYLLQYVLCNEGDNRRGEKEIRNFFGRDMLVNKDTTSSKPNTLVAMIYFKPGENHNDIMCWVKRMRDVTIFSNKDTFNELFFQTSSWLYDLTVYNEIVEYTDEVCGYYARKNEQHGFGKYINHRYFVLNDMGNEIDRRFNLDQDIATLYDFLYNMFNIKYDEIIRYFFKKECPNGNDFPRISSSFRYMEQYKFVNVRHQIIPGDINVITNDGIFETIFVFKEYEISQTIKMLPYQIDILGNENVVIPFINRCKNNSDFLISLMLDKLLRKIIVIAHKTGAISTKMSEEYNFTYLSRELVYSNGTFSNIRSFNMWVDSDAKVKRVMEFIGNGDISSAYEIIKNGLS